MSRRARSGLNFKLDGLTHNSTAQQTHNQHLSVSFIQWDRMNDANGVQDKGGLWCRFAPEHLVSTVCT